MEWFIFSCQRRPTLTKNDSFVHVKDNPDSPNSTYGLNGMTRATNTLPLPGRRTFLMAWSNVTGLSHRSNRLRQLMTSYVTLPLSQVSTSSTLHGQLKLYHHLHVWQYSYNSTLVQPLFTLVPKHVVNSRAMCLKIYCMNTFTYACTCARGHTHTHTHIQTKILSRSHTHTHT